MIEDAIEDQIDVGILVGAVIGADGIGLVIALADIVADRGVLERAIIVLREAGEFQRQDVVDDRAR